MELARAQNIAARVHAHLRKHCREIQICGSIRRQVGEVKDIEIVCAPNENPETLELFGGVTTWKRSQDFVEAVESLGSIVKGNPVDGRYVAIDICSTHGEILIRLDLFIPQYHDYWRMVAIRTGSRQFNFNITKAWIRLGWRGTPDGLRREDECIETASNDWKCTSPTPTLPPAWLSEELFFHWLNIPWVEPKDRNI